MEILKNIPFKLEIDKLLAALRMESDGEDVADVRNIAETVAPLIRPKAVYEVSYIQSRDSEKLNIGGVIFTSRMLSVNLEKVERVFPYIATCGNELEETAAGYDDFVKRFWIDTLKGMALGAAREYLKDYLKDKYALGKFSSMNPGSGTQNLWPIEQQKQLFSVFGNVEELIGVRLTESCLMIPNKTVSGIFYPAEVTFETCQLCSREGCPGRKATYNEKLLKIKYGK